MNKMRTQAFASVALLLAMAMPQDFSLESIYDFVRRKVHAWNLRTGRKLDEAGEVGVAHILVALIVVVIGVLILVTLLPIMSDSIASYSANYSGPGTALLLIIPLVIIAAAILWVLSVFDII